jgi:hypothetical protein
MALACALAAVLLIGIGGCGEGKKESPDDATATAACLKHRFRFQVDERARKRGVMQGIVFDERAREHGRWYGGKMVGQISVNSLDVRYYGSADIGFAESDKEAQKVERHIRRVGSAVPIETVFRRKGNVVIIWGGPPTGKVRRQVDGCVTRQP